MSERAASTWVLARDASALQGWRAVCELVGLEPRVSTWPAELRALCQRTPVGLVVVDAGDGHGPVAELGAGGPVPATVLAVTAADVPARLAALAAGARDTVAAGAPLVELAARAATWLRAPVVRRRGGLPAALVVGAAGDAARAWRTALAGAGWSAIPAPDAGMALAVLALSPTAGIVVDGRAGGVPGFALAHLVARLREATGAADTPLVVLADADGEAECGALAAGADAWIDSAAGADAAAERLAELGHGALGPLVALPPVPARVLWCQADGTAGSPATATLLAALGADADVVLARSAGEARAFVNAHVVDLIVHADAEAGYLRHPEDRDVPVVALGPPGPGDPPIDPAGQEDGPMRLPADGALALARARSLLRRRRRLVEARQAHAELRRRRLDTAEEQAIRALAESRGQLVAELERSRARLEETALALHEATLEAERLAQAKSRFLSSVSHELRTPLNAILGFGRVLEDSAYGPLTERQRAYLGDIVQAGEHMLRMVDDLLDLQRLDEGRDRYVPEPTALLPVVADAVRLVRAQAAEVGHELVTHVPADLPPCEVDARAFLQILTNLLSNAVKFTPPPGRIEVIVRAEGHAWVAIAVRDNGVGIPAEDHERIFEYFEQAQPPPGQPDAAGRGPGSGIGLALVRALVRRLGGRVWLASTPGAGSTFTFTVPVAGPVPALPAAESERSSP